MDSVSPCPQPSLPVHVADSVHESSVISLQPSDRMMAAAENAHLPVLALFKALTDSGNVGSMETLQRLSCSVTASSKASGGSPPRRRGNFYKTVHCYQIVSLCGCV